MSMRWKHDYIIKQIDVLKLLRSDADYLLAFPHQRALGAVLAADNVALALGRDLVINGDFATDTIWVKGTGWTIPGGNVAHCDGSQGATITNISQTIIAQSKSYEVTFTVSNLTQGGVFVSLAGTNGTNRTANGTYTETIVAGASGNDLRIRAQASLIADISVVTVQQTGILAWSDYPGAELLTQTNGVMDKGNWATIGVADLSNPSAGILRATRTTNPNPGAGQAKLTVGKRYKVTGQGRSDGNATLRLSDGVTIHWTGTNSTDWQDINTELVATGTNLTIQGVTNTGTEYTEWRNISLTEANPLNGDDTGTEPGVPMGSYYSKTDDGATSFSALGLTEYNSMINLELFHIGIGIQKAVWDTTERYFISHIIDADNWIKIGGTTTAGQLVYEIRAGGVTEQVLYASGSPTVIIMPSISSKGGVMKAWLGRTQVGGDVSIANTLAGNFASMTIGAENGTPQKVNLANRNWYWHMSDEKTTAELERIAKGIGAAL